MATGIGMFWGTLFEGLAVGYHGLTTWSLHKIDAPGDKLAWRIMPQTTSAITHIDLNARVFGTISGITFGVRVETDNGADYPSGVVLGAAGTFSGPAADGWIGPVALASNTGPLTIGTRYWVVVYVVSGSPSGSNALSIYEAMQAPNGVILGRVVQYNEGVGWQYPATYPVSVVVQRADGSYDGFPWTVGNLVERPATTRIYGTNRQGLRMRFGCKAYIRGARLQLYPVGASRGPIIVRLYEGATEKAASASISAATAAFAYNVLDVLFPTPAWCAANANLYLTVEQSGGNTSNYYSIRGASYNIAYEELALPGGYWRFVYGAGSDPTSYAVDAEGFVGFIMPLFSDPSMDLDEATTEIIQLNANVLTGELTKSLVGTIEG